MGGCKETMTTISLDTMGGDKGPQPLVKAALDLVRTRDIEIILVGDERLIKQSVSAQDLSRHSLSICHTSDVLTMTTDPKTAAMSLPNTSIFTATSLLETCKRMRY